MKKIHKYLIIVIFNFSFLYSESNESELVDLLQRADSQFLDGSYELANKSYKEIFNKSQKLNLYHLVVQSNNKIAQIIFNQGFDKIEDILSILDLSISICEDNDLKQEYVDALIIKALAEDSYPVNHLFYDSLAYIHNLAALSISKEIKYKKGIVLSNIGIANYNKYSGNLEESIRIGNILMEEYSDNSNNSLLYDIYRLQGLNYYWQYEDEKAKEFWDKSVQFARKGGNNYQIAMGLFTLANIQIYGFYEYENAKTNSLESLNLSKELEVPFLIAKNYNQLAENEFYEGNVNEAFNFINNAIEFIDKTKLKDKRLIDQEKRSYENLGYYNLQMGYNHKALEKFKIALELSLVHNMKDNLIRDYYTLGWTYSTLGDFDEAKEYIEKSLEITKSKAERLDPLNALADLYDRINEHSKAYKTYLEAIEIAEDLNNDPMLAILYHNFGNSLNYLAIYDEAEYYLKKSLQVVTPKDKNGEMYAKGTLGEVYLNSEKFDLSENMFDNALVLATQLGLPENQARYSEGLGHIYLEKDNFKKAEEYFRNAYSIREPMGNIISLIWTNYSFARLHLEKKEFSIAKSYLQKAESMIDDYPYNTEFQGHYDMLLGDYYFEQGSDSLASIQYVKSINIFEKSRQNIASEEHRAAYSSSYKKLYKRNIKAFGLATKKRTHKEVMLLV